MTDFAVGEFNLCAKFKFQFSLKKSNFDLKTCENFYVEINQISSANTDPILLIPNENSIKILKNSTLQFADFSFNPSNFKK